VEAASRNRQVANVLVLIVLFSRSTIVATHKDLIHKIIMYVGKATPDGHEARGVLAPFMH
jgi:hypothetical protein